LKNIEKNFLFFNGTYIRKTIGHVVIQIENNLDKNTKI